MNARLAVTGLRFRPLFFFFLQEFRRKYSFWRAFRAKLLLSQRNPATGGVATCCSERNFVNIDACLFVTRFRGISEPLKSCCCFFCNEFLYSPPPAPLSPSHYFPLPRSRYLSPSTGVRKYTATRRMINIRSELTVSRDHRATRFQDFSSAVSYDRRVIRDTHRSIFLRGWSSTLHSFGGTFSTRSQLPLPALPADPPRRGATESSKRMDGEKDAPQPVDLGRKRVSTRKVSTSISRGRGTFFQRQDPGARS